MICGTAGEASGLSVAVAFALVGCLLLEGCGSTSSKSSKNSVNLQVIALQKTDVPQGFSRDPERYWTNPQAARRDHIPLSTYASHGRILSYYDSYSVSLTSNVQAGGLVRAQSEITQFKNPSGARWYWSRSRAAASKAFIYGATTLGANSGEAGKPVFYRPIRAATVGDQSAAFAVQAGGDEVNYQLTVLVWRRLNFVGMLRVRAVAEEFPLSKIVAMARRMNSRIPS